MINSYIGLFNINLSNDKVKQILNVIYKNIYYENIIKS